MPLESKPPVTDTTGPPSWMAPVMPVVPDHELLRRIGGGSYGDVWLARTTVGTWRAVKVVFRDRFTDARPYEREFNGMQKFEPLSRGNEGFIDILQIGRNDAEGYFYYVMELADDAATIAIGGTSYTNPQSPSIESGPCVTRPSEAMAVLHPDSYVPKTLAKVLLQRGRLPLRECLELGVTLNLGLAHLHRAGLIHRDIKPSNLIFVGGVPKLADIGLVIEMTEARSYVGTEGFIPPEGPNSPQADLYSLGKVLYEAGMGKDRKDFPEPFTQIIDAPDSAQLLEFNAILLKACAANVKQRYQSAEEMNADLALLQSGGSVRHQRKLAGQLRFVQRAGALVTALAAVIALGWWWQARQTHLVSELVVEKTQLADTNRRLAEEQTHLATEKTKLAEENRERIVRLDVANGVRLLDDKDPSAALLWFADALPLVTNRLAEEEIHRVRIQQTLDQTPRLSHVMSYESSVLASAFSPDGHRLVTATSQHKLTMWDAHSGQMLWERPHESKALRQIRFARDGQRLLVCSSENQGRASFDAVPPMGQMAEILDVQTGEPVIPQLNSNHFGSAFSPDDRWLAVALTNHVIQVFDTRNGQPVVELKGHTNEITMLAFSAEGGFLVSGSRDQTARIWRLPTGELVGSPFMHDLPIRRVALSPGGRHLVTATSESNETEASQIQVWDVQNAKRVGELITVIGNVRALFFSPKGDVLFSSGEAEGVRVWDLGDGVKLLRTLAFPSVRCWDFNFDGRRLALGTDSGFVSIWNLESWELLFPPFRHTGWVESVHFSPDGSRLLTTSDDGTAKVWSLKHETEAAWLELSAKIPEGPANFQRPRGGSSGRLPIRLADEGLHLIDSERLTELQVLRVQETNASFGGWEVSPSGRFCALDEQLRGAPPKVTISLWSNEGRDWRRLALPHPSFLAHTAFNADESRLFTFCSDGNVRVWRTSDGSLERSIPAMSGSLWYLPTDYMPAAFRPDCGALLLGYGETYNDQHLQLFDLDTDKLTGKPFLLTKIRGSANRMRFSPDGRRLASVGEDQSGSIIDLKTGELVVPQFKHGGGLLDLDWSPDARRLITAGEAAEVKLWDAATGEMLLSPMTSGKGTARSARWSADGRFIATRSDDNRARVFDASTTEPVTPFLPHSGYIRWVCITPGNRLITASDPNLLRAWDLKPTPLATEVIADYAKLLSGRRLNASGVLLPLKASELSELNHSLRARAPQLFE